MAEHQVESCSCSLNSYQRDFVSQLDIGFPARDMLDMFGVDHPEGKAPIEDIQNRAPVDAGALEHHIRTADLSQPRRERFEIRGHGAELADRLVGLPVLIDPEATGDHEAFVDSSAGTVREHPLHR